VNSGINNWDADEREALEKVRAELDALRQRHENDPPLELLRAARADALPEELRDEVNAHLQHSSWSQALLEGAESVEAQLDESRQQRFLERIGKGADGSREPRSFWSAVWRPAIAAGALALAVLAVVITRGPSAGSEKGAPQSPAIAVAPRPPEYLLALEKPVVKLTPLATTWRGARGENQFLKDMTPALNAYRRDDYAQATREFSSLTAKYPESVEVFFYLGVSQLFEKDAAGAVRSFETAKRVAPESFAQQTAWYLAVAYERDGRKELFESALREICSTKGEFSARACKVVAR
jgi:TolA-binding protein